MPSSIALQNLAAVSEAATLSVSRTFRVTGSSLGFILTSKLQDSTFDCVGLQAPFATVRYPFQLVFQN